MKKNGISGFSFVEMLIVSLILVMAVGGAFVIFSSGQSAWFTTDVQIRLQENLRQVVDKISSELRQSRVGQGQIFDDVGTNNSDIVRFSIPIVCEADGKLLDQNGDVQNWGAPLTWGCTDSTCMDEDDDCLTRDYASVEYEINDSNQLVRQVLNEANNEVREDIFANNITDFQVALNGEVITLTVTGQVTSDMNREFTAQATHDIYLRN